MTAKLIRSQQPIKFPTGEMHIKTGAGFDILKIPMQPNLNDYLMSVMLGADATHRSLGGQSFDLFMPYLPYSRQDRPTSDIEPFSLQVVGRMLSALPYRKLYTLDVHSDVAYACVRDLVNIPVQYVWDKWGDIWYDRTLLVPDQGAYKRLYPMINKFEGVSIAVKHRDTQTGKLEIIGVVGGIAGKRLVIVDDICDGGGTFVLLANELYAMGAQEVQLAITHGVFTKGIEILQEAGIKKIYSTDSFPRREEHKEHIITMDCDFILTNYLELTQNA